MQAEDVESESDLPPSKKMRTGMESYRATTRTPLATFQGHKSTVTSVVWAGSSGSGVWSDDDIITGGWDNSIRIWDVATGINKNTLVSKYLGREKFKNKSCELVSDTLVRKKLLHLSVQQVRINIKELRCSVYQDLSYSFDVFLPVFLFLR